MVEESFQAGFYLELKFPSRQTVDIIFKHKRRKDRLAAVSKAIAVVREKES